MWTPAQEQQPARQTRKAAGIDPTEGSGDWYRETGSGMGATLNTGTGMGAYVMTDRATWISFGNKQDFEVLVEGDPALLGLWSSLPATWLAQDADGTWWAYEAEPHRHSGARFRPAVGVPWRLDPSRDAQQIHRLS